MDEVFSIETVARVCHEANRAFCLTLGDTSQPSWDDAPDWQKDSARNVVSLHFAAMEDGRELEPSASHESWLAEKAAAGWKYGPTKNAETKEHPCFVAYDMLPFEQKGKDYLFGGICRAAYSAQHPGWRNPRAVTA